MTARFAPRDCPVCGEEMALTRLSCRSCGTELAGDFQSCEFCALDVQDRETLRVFLSSRGNIKELERHLGVSYPTARARLDSLLSKLGIERPEPQTERVEVLERLARGEIDVEAALEQIRTEG